MKTDLYTKVVLTMIAVLLTLNLVKTDGFITKANASEGQRYVQVPVNADGSINVNVLNVPQSQAVIISGYRNKNSDRYSVTDLENGFPVKIK